MDLIKLITKLSSTFVAEDAMESEKMTKFLAQAVCWDEEVTDEEREAANKILREHFEKHMSLVEFRAIKIDFENKIKEYMNDNRKRLNDKRELESLFIGEDYDYYMKILKKVFSSDGLSDKEKETLEKLEN